MSAKHRENFLAIDVEDFNCSVVEPHEKEAIEWAQELVHQLTGWTQAYPIKIFPEPDSERANQVLREHGMTVDALSAAMGRHVLKRVGEMVGKDVETGEDLET